MQLFLDCAIIVLNSMNTKDIYLVSYDLICILDKLLCLLFKTSRCIL